MRISIFYEMANITQVHKKGNWSDRNTYQPVSTLPKLFKVLERCLGKQISESVFSLSIDVDFERVIALNML